MSYAQFETPPEHIRWCSTLALPAVGDRITVTFNKLGDGEVIGYFTEGGYLGLLVQLDQKPDWLLEQNPTGPVHIFGPEFRRAS